MQFRVRKAAHVLERCGLALAGASCGLFVGAYVGSAIPVLTTQGFLLLMMLLGAVGFYLGIDAPQLHLDPKNPEVDTAEFLSAAGTFCATLTAFASVAVIVLRLEPHAVWTWLVLLGWVAGVAMQITAGATARWRRRS
ncbi:hypothetical protein C2U70_08730 [Bradyrhizobium guangdongense]|uniref:hypothetical protein n=1 Tax=Bradyrhizobium guangdongense TaxID=1325090 RepID=UPI00112CBDCC|nr:hypothetical protein [Bradyrhizobium guangdongense]TPQ38587.1 hypothetical protein C2U70_08730 [Bradyrhizobium guangdongense]